MFFEKTKSNCSCLVVAAMTVNGWLSSYAFAVENLKDPNNSAKEQISNIEPQHLKLVWNVVDGTKKSIALEKKSEKKAWLTSCNSLGKRLLTGQGPWGFGVFASFSCWIDDVKISGKPTEDAWTLTFLETDKLASLTLEDAAHRTASEVSFASSIYSVYFFADKEFADLVALKLLNGLPFMGYLPKGTLTEDGLFTGRYIDRQLKFERKAPIVPPPKSLIATRLIFDKSTGLRQAQIEGQVSLLTLDPEDPVGSQNKKLKDKDKNKKIPVVHWRANGELIKKNKELSVWLHDKRGPNRLASALQIAIDQTQKILSDSADQGILSSVLRGVKKGASTAVASGYLGIRYGPQLLKGDKLLEKTAIFGLLAEARGGPIDGVRFYYDKLPRKAVEQDGFETSIEWSRLIVGKSFGLKLNHFADRIDVTPKIGVWNFHTKLPNDWDEDGQVASVGSFDLDRAMSFSLETGLEWQSSWYIVRPWYSFDGAGFISKLNSKRVTSNRFGLDTYWTAGPKFRLFERQFCITWLGFFIYESIGLASNKDVTLTEDDSVITDMSYSTTYAGLGMAVSW